MTTTYKHWLVERQGPVTVATFIGQRHILDDTNIPEASQELLSLVEPTCSRLVVNVIDLRFMQSTMLSRLTELGKACKQKSIHLILCNVSPEIMEVFKITRLNKRFEIFNSLEEACA